MRMFDKMTKIKIKCLGVPEPNNEMRFCNNPHSVLILEAVILSNILIYHIIHDSG